MEIDNMSNDGQPQPTAAALLTPAGAELVERLSTGRPHA
jgi:hypothetical protein